MCIFVSYSLSASNVEVSKYLISSSFQINLHIIVLSRNVMGPLWTTIATIHVAHARQNDLGHNFGFLALVHIVWQEFGVL